MEKIRILRSGFFISFEGIEGGGKTTHIYHLAQFLSKKDYDVKVTREPGGTPVAEAARHILLSYGVDEFGSCAESIFFASIRRDHIETIIRPALTQGKIVLCDRFVDSSYAYQSYGDDAKSKFLDSLQKVSIQGIMPDCTIILDLPVDIGLQRIHRRYSSKKRSGLDRFERRDIKSHEMQRQIFLDIARNHPERCHVVDAMKPIKEVSMDIINIIDKLIQNPDILLRKKNI